MDSWRQLNPKKGLDLAVDGMASLASRVMGQQTTQTMKHRNTRDLKFYTLNIEVSHHVKVRIVSAAKRRELFSAVLGEAIPDNTEFSVRRYDDELVIKFIGYAVLTITHRKQEQSHRYDVEWRMAIDGQGCFQDCISFYHNHWFGACLGQEQMWPINCQHRLSPFVCWDSSYDPKGGYGSALERYWLSSSGIAVYVDSEVPLFVSMENDQGNQGNQGITLVAKFEKPYQNLVENNLFLKYSIIESSNMKVSHDLIKDEYFMKPGALPCPLLFQKPIWSTSYFGAEVSDSKVLTHVEESLEHGFSPGVLIFDDDWTPAYGDLVFNPKQFLDCKDMIQTIKNKDFTVLLWVHPFASPRSTAFFNGANLWVKSSMIEGITAWKHGPAKLLDVTNPDTRTWFKKKLMDLKEEHGVDGFKFDYGQVNYLPGLSKTYDPLSNPNSFSRSYISIATDISYENQLSLIPVGVGTQNAPLMLCLEKKSCSWGWNNGLKTVIPSVLSLGVSGYPFVLTGTVGGTNHSMRNLDRELYVRWLETVLLMPAFSFSLPPWELGDETLDLVKELMKLRKSFLEYLERVASDSVQTGDPMVRPLWWKAPEDSIAQTIDSQFMLGDQLLVAPVQEKGMTNRSIYLPCGVWKDELRGKTIHGKKWLYSYHAKLGELPRFTLQETIPDKN